MPIYQKVIWGYGNWGRVLGNFGQGIFKHSNFEAVITGAILGSYIEVLTQGRLLVGIQNTLEIKLKQKFLQAFHTADTTAITVD